MIGNIVQKTTADIIYEQLRDNIITLYYKPGEKLSEAKLSARYGVSRDPVRKAIARLIQDGMIESKPQVGTMVNKLSIKDGIDVCEIRLILETYAISNAVLNIDEETIQELVREYDKISKRLELQDDDDIKAEIYALDGKMHNAIYKASGNDKIQEVIKSFSHVIKRIQISNMTYHQRKMDTMEEMHEIIIALSERDREKAVCAMRTHIENIKKTLSAEELQ